METQGDDRSELGEVAGHDAAASAPKATDDGAYGRGAAAQSAEAPNPTSAEADPPHAARYLGIGCLMSVAGFFSGGMIAVLFGKVVGGVTGCVPDPGTPACNWHIYMLAGAIIGLLTLPFLTIRRLRSGAAPSDRG